MGQVDQRDRLLPPLPAQQLVVVSKWVATVCDINYYLLICQLVLFLMTIVPLIQSFQENLVDLVDQEDRLSLEDPVNTQRN